VKLVKKEKTVERENDYNVGYRLFCIASDALRPGGSEGVTQALVEIVYLACMMELDCCQDDCEPNRGPQRQARITELVQYLADHNIQSGSEDSPLLGGKLGEDDCN
jgi:hypothetical protein